MKILRIPLSLFSLLLIPLSFAKDMTRPTNGLHRFEPRVHALEHAIVWISPSEMLEDATIVLRDGLIEKVGVDIVIPDDARSWDMSGKVIYAGFIDAYSNFGMPDGLKPYKSKRSKPGEPPAKRPETPKTPGATHWNPMITPDRDTVALYAFDESQAESLHEMGFTTAASYPGRGIARGEGLLLNIEKSRVNRTVLKAGIAQHFSLDTSYFDWGSLNSDVPYPSSLMGSIALVRQTLLDAQWFGQRSLTTASAGQNTERLEANAAFEALQPLMRREQLGLFVAKNELDYQRIGRIGEEFDLDIVLLGNGYEYRRSDYLKKLGATVILPLHFPKAPSVERADAALDISYEQLQHWDFAASNPALLEQAGISFCLSSSFQPDADSFWSSTRKAIKRGLSKQTALAALTTQPAELYEVETTLGTVEAGKIANLTVASGDLFEDEKAKVALVWIDGKPIERDEVEAAKLSGSWRFSWNGVDGFEEGTIEEKGPALTLKVGDDSLPVIINGPEALLLAKNELFGGEADKEVARLKAYVGKEDLWGSGWLADGSSFSWKAVRFEKESDPEADEKVKSEAEANEGDEEQEDPQSFVFTHYPAGAFGVALDKNPEPQTLLVRNATVWTSGPEGVLENTDILFKDGTVARIGKELRAPKGAIEIDGTGKHVTPGLIDCHSHTAFERGINEIGSAITVEVRVGDIVNPVDINIYRQLAGGLTTANLLHGSANPMGGQSQVIKLRWGEDAEGLKFAGAKPGVKFALGENVKQSNWGDNMTSRYPQTRMGVEQIMESNFRAAEEYEANWAAYKAGNIETLPRRDLRLEAVLEILRGKRSVHIHSYRQDEILMFARMAKRLNLDVSAFQHILEGYKVADAMAEINAGGSTFSDWWAYKYEVIDAIPYNARLMHDAGVVVSFNSDDNELATRLNTEAAKAVKYGGLSEEEALKFVTINPAIQLRIEDQVGSLEIGKDADFVVWSTHPLSTYAYAEQTWIEGIKRFDKTEDAQRFDQDKADRQRLVQKALADRLNDLNSSLESKKPDGNSSAGATAEGDPPPDPEWQWIYHNGETVYSCTEHEGHEH